jgi:hypothetical protein
MDGFAVLGSSSSGEAYVRFPPASASSTGNVTGAAAANATSAAAANATNAAAANAAAAAAPVDTLSLGAAPPPVIGPSSATPADRNPQPPPADQRDALPVAVRFSPSDPPIDVLRAEGFEGIA